MSPEQRVDASLERVPDPAGDWGSEPIQVPLISGRFEDPILRQSGRGGQPRPGGPS